MGEVMGTCDDAGASFCRSVDDCDLGIDCLGYMAEIQGTCSHGSAVCDSTMPCDTAQSCIGSGPTMGSCSHGDCRTPPPPANTSCSMVLQYNASCVINGVNASVDTSSIVSGCGHDLVSGQSELGALVDCLKSNAPLSNACQDQTCFASLCATETSACND